MVGRSILIVDDEAPIREMIAVALEMAGYDCLEAENSQQAHAIIVDRKPDLILLDWMLPGTSGIELARRLKRDELTGDIPIIMLPAKGEEDNKIQGLEVGADDYITKPFEIEELLARIRVIQRRADNQIDLNQVYQADDVQLDTKAHRVTNADEEVILTHREYDLLQFFLAHPDEVFTRDDLLDQVWGADFLGQQNVVDVYVGYLRSKLATPDAAPLIKTVRGVGYKLREPMSNVQE